MEVLVHEADGIRRIALELTATATVGSALLAAGLSPDCQGRVGIHGRLCSVDEVLADGARIEVYRPLLADPKQVRRQRARVRRPVA